MTRKTYVPIYLKAWRKHRGLTQERLAERIGCSVSLISMIEKGTRQYDQDFLEAAAEALSTDPSSLLRIDPLKPDSYESVFEQLRRVPESDLPRLSAALNALFPGPTSEAPAPAPKKRKAG